MSRLSLLALLIPAIVACDPEDPCGAAATVTPTVRIGTGEDELVLLSDGDQVEVEYGPQGGRHIWVGIRTEGIAPGRNLAIGHDDPGPVVMYSLWSSDGIELGSGWSDQPLKGDETGAERTGDELYVEWYGSYSSTTLDPKLVTIRAEVEDQCGTRITAEVDVNAYL